MNFPVVGSICAPVVFSTDWDAMMVGLGCGDFGLAAIANSDIRFLFRDVRLRPGGILAVGVSRSGSFSMTGYYRSV